MSGGAAAITTRRSLGLLIDRTGGQEVGPCRWSARESVSSRTPTSRSRFATADRPGRARGSLPAAVRVASDTRAGRRSHRRFRGRRTGGFDRVGRGTELVCGDVRHRCRLAGGERDVPSSPVQLSSGSHRMAGRSTGPRHLDLAARPRPDLLDRVAGPRIRGLLRLEEVKDVLCARRRPQAQEPVVGVRERPPAADRDETRVALLGEDHGSDVC